MDDFVSNPAVQGGVAPLAAGLILAAALVRARLAGLAAAGGFLTAAYLMGNLSFWPMTATRKILLLAIVSPALGVVADFAFKPHRASGLMLGALFGLASVWVFWSVLAQRPAAIEGQLTLLGVSRPVTLTVENWKCGPDPRTQGKRYMCGGNASGAIKRSDFGMKFGIGPISDEIKLMIGVEAIRD